LKKYLAGLRLKEIGGKTGFFLVGVFFSKPAISTENILVTFHFIALCMMNGVAVYLINAGLGYEQDKSNERLKELRQFKHATLLTFGFLVLLLSLTWLYWFSDRLLLPASIIYGIWILYSLPKGLKTIPLLGIACGFVAQVFHFHIGYLVFSEWSINSILLSVYFAFLFAGGHALHEVIDYEADAKASIQTSAVFFGRQMILKFSVILFTVAAIWMIFLTGLKILSAYEMIPYIMAFLFQVWLFCKLPDCWSNEDLFLFRRKYMTAYLLATVTVLLIFYIR
jgi:4-hydroxybenzoate polyprenyltransferase